MPTEIRMPRVMESMTHGAVASWRKAEGESVRAGEVIAEIEADKSTVDLESPGDGTLSRILVPAGTEKVEVGAVLAVLDEATSALPRELPVASPARSEADNGHAPNSTADTPHPNPPPHRGEGRNENALPPRGGGLGGGVAACSETATGCLASPLARSMARQAGLDLSSIPGTGSGGTIVHADVLRELERAPALDAQAPAPESPGETLPHSRIRRVIAERLSESKRTIPHFYLEVQCCVDPLLRVREELATRREGGPRLSLNDLAVRAAALALRAVPEANASWTEEGMRRHRRIDLAVAIATDAGLVAPVVRDADRKGLAELSVELRDLALRAREGRLRPQELEGGTFTVSNLGMHGVDAMYAIINPPQAGILGLGAAGPRPVARDGSVVIATMMTCTLSADHRVFDGATGARLLSAFKGFVEQPLTMLL